MSPQERRCKGIDIILNSPVPDAFEPNDSFAAATPTACPTTLDASIHAVKGDIDFYRFSANAGASFIAEITAQRAGSTLDALIGVFDSDGNLLASNDDFFGLDPVFQLTLPATGDYFLVVTSSHDTDFNSGSDALTSGFYTLVMSCLEPIPPGTSGVLFVGAPSSRRVLALADLDGDLVADRRTVFVEGVLPLELAFDAQGDLVVGHSIRGLVTVHQDADGDFVGDSSVTFSSGSDEVDGLATLRIGETDVIFVSDRFSGGFVNTFSDADGDNLPDETTIFSRDPRSGISLGFTGSGHLLVIDVFGSVILSFADRNAGSLRR